ATRFRPLPSGVGERLWTNWIRPGHASQRVVECPAPVAGGGRGRLPTPARYFNHPFTANTYNDAAIAIATPKATCLSVTAQGLPTTFMPRRPPARDRIRP